MKKRRQKPITKAEAREFEWLWHGTTQAARENCQASAKGRRVIRLVEKVLGNSLTIS